MVIKNQGTRYKMYDEKCKKPKVYCAGLSRTGTTSLNLALQILGWKSIHYPRTTNLRELSKIEAITDLPGSLWWRELYEIDPKNSKVILTVRDIEDWITSCSTFISKKPPRALDSIEKFYRRHLYGTIEFDKELYEKSYREHVSKINDYFQDNNDSFLELSIVNKTSDEDLWERLCKFLSVKIPKNKPFPHKRIIRR